MNDTLTVQPMNPSLHLIAAVLDSQVTDSIDRLLDAGYIPDKDYGFFQSLTRPDHVCLMCRSRADAAQMQEALR